MKIFPLFRKIGRMMRHRAHSPAEGRRVSDVKREGRALVVLRDRVLRFEFSVRKAKLFMRRHTRAAAVIASVAVALVSVSVIVRGLAHSADFYPTSCLGNWEGVANVLGRPELAPGAPAANFNGINSAAPTTGTAQMFCGNFSGDTPIESLQDNSFGQATLVLSWSFAFPEDAPSAPVSGEPLPVMAEPPQASSTAASSTDSGASSTAPAAPGSAATTSLPEGPQGAGSAPAAAQPDASGSASVPEAPTSSAVIISASTTVQSSLPPPSGGDAAPPSPAPSSSPSDSAPPPAPAPDASSSPPSSFFWGFFRTAYADEASSVQTIVSSSSAVVSSTGAAASSTEGPPAISVNTDVVTAITAPSSSAGDILNISFSTDGVNWSTLANINKDNWQQSRYAIPIHSWNELKNLQIVVIGLNPPVMPKISIDAIAVEVDYGSPGAQPPAATTATTASVAGGAAGPSASSSPASQPSAASSSASSTLSTLIASATAALAPHAAPPAPAPVPKETVERIFDPAAKQSCSIAPFSKTVKAGYRAEYLVTLHPVTNAKYAEAFGTLPRGVTASMRAAPAPPPSGNPQNGEAPPEYSYIDLQTSSTTPGGSYSLVFIYRDKDTDAPNFCQYNLVVE